MRTWHSRAQDLRAQGLSQEVGQVWRAGLLLKAVLRAREGLRGRGRCGCRGKDHWRGLTRIEAGGGRLADDRFRRWRQQPQTAGRMGEVWRREAGALYLLKAEVCRKGVAQRAREAADKLLRAKRARAGWRKWVEWAGEKEQARQAIIRGFEHWRAWRQAGALRVKRRSLLTKKRRKIRGAEGARVGAHHASRALVRRFWRRLKKWCFRDEKAHARKAIARYERRRTRKGFRRLRTSVAMVGALKTMARLAMSFRMVKGWKRWRARMRRKARAKRLARVALEG